MNRNDQAARNLAKWAFVPAVGAMAGGMLLAAAQPASADPVEFDYPTQNGQWSVPQGSCGAQVVAIGGGGGSAASSGDFRGGYGALVSAFVGPLTAQTDGLSVYVGGAGATGAGGAGGGGGGSTWVGRSDLQFPPVIAGGGGGAGSNANGGGGNGGDGASAYTSDGGAGGGASDSNGAPGGLGNGGFGGNPGNPPGNNGGDGGGNSSNPNVGPTPNGSAGQNGMDGFQVAAYGGSGGSGDLEAPVYFGAGGGGGGADSTAHDPYVGANGAGGGNAAGSGGAAGGSLPADSISGLGGGGGGAGWGAGAGGQGASDAHDEATSGGGAGGSLGPSGAAYASAQFSTANNGVGFPDQNGNALLTPSACGSSSAFATPAPTVSAKLRPRALKIRVGYSDIRKKLDGRIGKGSLSQGDATPVVRIGERKFKLTPIHQDLKLGVRGNVITRSHKFELPKNLRKRLAKAAKHDRTVKIVVTVRQVADLNRDHSQLSASSTTNRVLRKVAVRR